MDFDLVKRFNLGYMEFEPLRLSLQDSGAFADALLGPPAMSPALARAFERRVVLLGTDDDGMLVLAAFRKAASTLGLTDPQQTAVLGVPPATSGPVQDRMALLVNLVGLAEQAFPGGGVAWFRRPNQAALFGGGTPLDWILQGEDLAQVQEHLQAAVRIL
jgi:hypothetical protein